VDAPAIAGHDARRVADLLKMVADRTRLRVLLLLESGPRNVTDIVGQVELTQAATSHHLALLRHGGMVVCERAGKCNFYSLTDKGRALVGAIRSLCG
jgi:DNA-binding transcriptional ArsR family regulator